MNAVATLLFSPDYLPGALVLGHTLRKIVDGNTKLVILIDLAAFSPLHIHLLRLLWDDVRDTKVFQSQLHHKLIHDLQRPELASTFTKVQLWDLPYDKVLYLDADTLPLIGGATSVCDLLKLEFPVGKIVAAPDSGFPDIFNSGVFALRPNKSDYLNLLSLVMSNNKDISFDGADQGLLNQYFNSDPDWVALALTNGVVDSVMGQISLSSNWIKVPFLYNTTPNTQYQYAPAFNYFQPENSPHQVNEAISPSSYSNSAVSNPVDSAVLAAAAYQTTAFNHYSIKPGSHVKLIHFIGPAKPWNSEASGLFSAWWKEWYDYSGGKLLYETLYRQFYGITVKSLYIPGHKTDDSQEAIAGHDVFVEPELTVQETSLAKKVFQPADLCDPNNYQQFASEPVNWRTAWDATVEQPPVEEPELTTFDADIRAFNSSWNELKNENQSAHLETQQNSADSEGHQEIDTVKPESFPSPLAVNEVLQQQTDQAETFGYHKDYKAERSFDDSFDYNPTHYLLEKQKEVETAAAYNAAITTQNAKDQEISQLVKDLDIDEEEEYFVEEEQKNDLELNEPDLLPEESGIKKLFPWEFRTPQVASRCWD